jgi:hypothetical protein
LKAHSTVILSKKFDKIAVFFDHSASDGHELAIRLPAQKTFLPKQPIKRSKN